MKHANQDGTTEDTHHPVGVINSIHVNFCNKFNSRGRIWVSGATLHFQAVYPVLIIGLKEEEEMAVRRASIKQVSIGDSRFGLLLLAQ